MANTGYQGWLKLKKVVDGGIYDGQPLDDNNNLCSVSGLPQSIKDNIDSDPDYVAPILNTEACPIPTFDVELTVNKDIEVTAPIEIIVTDLNNDVVVLNTPIVSRIEVFSITLTTLTNLLKVEIINSDTEGSVTYEIDNGVGYIEGGTIPFGTTTTRSDVPKLDFEITLTNTLP